MKTHLDVSVTPQKSVCKCRTPQNYTALSRLHTRSHAGQTRRNLQLAQHAQNALSGLSALSQGPHSRRPGTDEETGSGETSHFQPEQKTVWRTRRLSVVHTCNLQLQKLHSNAELCGGPAGQQRYYSIWLALRYGTLRAELFCHAYSRYRFWDVGDSL
jgi:hypothetical protein